MICAYCGDEIAEDRAMDFKGKLYHWECLYVCKDCEHNRVTEEGSDLCIDCTRALKY